MNLWLYIIGGLFAALGIWTVVRWIANGWKQLIATVNDLINTLKDAAEIAKAYREDVQILKQIAQQGAAPNFGYEPESIIPRERETAPASMPSPIWSRFPIKTEEPEAPLEAAAQVDVTASEEELAEQERDERALDFETQERQKAATRDADHERLKALTEQGGEPQ